MIVNVKWISENYNKFNKLYWNDQLPHNLKFKLSRAKRSWGFAAFKYDYPNNTIIPTELIISNYYDSPEEVKLHTLLHEMIHIADYTFHPEHFIKNHRAVHGRHYNAHGWWFLKEAERINKFGWHVSNIVTNEEIKASKLSIKSQINENTKKANAIICVIYGTNCNFYFKTDVNKIENVKKSIKRYTFIKIGDIKKVKYYKFENKSMAMRRSCSNSLVGWFATYQQTMNMLQNVKATEVRF